MRTKRGARIGWIVAFLPSGAGGDGGQWGGLQFVAEEDADHLHGLQSARRGTTLTNFPALVVLSNGMASGFSYGDFLSLTNQDLRSPPRTAHSELNYEIESWNTNGGSYVWVQVTNLVDNNTCVWAYWGKAGTNAPAYTTNGATWDSTFAGVWHLKQTNALDSTANTNNANLSVAIADAAGEIGGADGFNGSSTYININRTRRRFSRRSSPSGVGQRHGQRFSLGWQLCAQQGPVRLISLVVLRPLSGANDGKIYLNRHRPERQA